VSYEAREGQQGAPRRAKQTKRELLSLRLGCREDETTHAAKRLKRCTEVLEQNKESVGESRATRAEETSET
jgi:hypothetical protein